MTALLSILGLILLMLLLYRLKACLKKRLYRPKSRRPAPKGIFGKIKKAAALQKLFKGPIPLQSIFFFQSQIDHSPV